MWQFVHFILRYNSLLVTINTSLDDLQKGIAGLVVMSTELDEIFNCIYEGRVPSSWLKGMKFSKSLSSFTKITQKFFGTQLLLLERFYFRYTLCLLNKVISKWEYQYFPDSVWYILLPRVMENFLLHIYIRACT